MSADWNEWTEQEATRDAWSHRIEEIVDDMAADRQALEDGEMSAEEFDQKW